MDLLPSSPQANGPQDEANDTSAGALPLPATVPPKWNEIDECIIAMNTERQMESTYPRINSEDCDTAIIFDAPPRSPDISQRMYEVISRHYDRVFPANSLVLLAHSPTIFGPMFEPRKQKKWSSKLMTKLREPMSWTPKYAIDLTPSVEGDDATQLLMDLCCPPVVTLWHMSKLRFRCPHEIVWGTEEFSKLSDQWIGTAEDNSEAADENFPVVPDYTQLRHYRAIERLILTLHGEEVDLDSAVKVYSTAAVSNNFRIINGGPLHEMVAGWIYHPQNKFLQIAPEASIKIADWLAAANIARDAFAVLVGEASQSSASGQPCDGRTRYGRKIGDLDEIWQTRVQYACESFEQRIAICFESLTEESMTWVETLPEVRKLVSVRDSFQAPIQDGSTAALIQTRIESWKRLVRRCIYLCLCSEMVYSAKEGINPRFDAQKLHPDTDFVSAWNSTPWKSRIFTATFWKLLGSMNIRQLASHVLVSKRQLTVGLPVELAFKTSTKASRAALQEAGVWVEDGTTIIVDHDPLGALSGELSEDVSGWTPSLWSAKDNDDDAQQGGRQMLTDDAQRTSIGHSSPQAIALRPHFASTRQGPKTGSDQTETGEAIAANSERGVHTPHPLLLARNAILYDSHPGAIDVFYKEVQRTLKSQAMPMLRGPPGSALNAKSVRLLDVLICLDEDEIQCLPLWAGGCDDGTGGVFSTAIASSEERFEGGAEFARGGEEEGFETMTITNSEVPTSLMVQDGYGEVMDRRRAYAISEFDSEDSFGVVDDSGATAAATSIDGADQVRSFGSDTPTLSGSAAEDDFTDIFIDNGDSDDDL